MSAPASIPLLIIVLINSHLSEIAVTALVSASVAFVIVPPDVYVPNPVPSTAFEVTKPPEVQAPYPVPSTELLNPESVYKSNCVELITLT